MFIHRAHSAPMKDVGFRIRVQRDRREFMREYMALHEPELEGQRDNSASVPVNYETTDEINT